ncbi:MAG: hypothetical protein QM768_12095 [Agriterribacter sp.]
MLKPTFSLVLLFVLPFNSFDPLTGPCQRGGFHYSSAVVLKYPNNYEVTNKIINDEPKKGDLVVVWEAGKITQYTVKDPIKKEGAMSYTLTKPHAQTNTPMLYGSDGKGKCSADCYVEDAFTKYTAFEKQESKAAVIDENGRVLDRVFVIAEIIEPLKTASLRLSISPGSQFIFYGPDSLKQEEFDNNSISLTRSPSLPRYLDERFIPGIRNWLNVEGKGAGRGRLNNGSYIYIRNNSAEYQDIQFTMRGNKFSNKEMKMILLQENFKGFLGFEAKVYFATT